MTRTARGHRRKAKSHAGRYLLLQPLRCRRQRSSISPCRSSTTSRTFVTSRTGIPWFSASSTRFLGSPLEMKKSRVTAFQDKDQTIWRRVCARCRGRGAASPVRHHRLAFAIGRVVERGEDIFMGEIGKIGKYLLFGHP